MLLSNQRATPPRYFHTVYLFKSKHNAFYSSYRMSQPSLQCQPTLSDCYNELMVDPSLLQSFSEDEWMSAHGLPYLHALCFGIVSERLFTLLTSPVLWGKAGADFITNAGQRAMSAEITPLAILIMDGMGEGKLGMITNFCRSDQVKVESLDTLLNI